MNKQPVRYSQVDSRWKNADYSAKGENTTIGISGCGPTCAAMLIETFTGKKYTPVDACKWSLEHGYKAVGQGTYYSYFVPQFKVFGIDCYQLSWTNTYHKPNHENHKKAFDLLVKGNYLIALMKKGLWTGSGHFVIVWWQDGKVRINDPASTKDIRLNGDINTFRNECAYYWVVKPIAKKEEEEEEMDQLTFNKMFNSAMDSYLNSLSKEAVSNWAEKAIKEMQDRDITDGTRPQSFATRQELFVAINRFRNSLESEK